MGRDVDLDKAVEAVESALDGRMESYRAELKELQQQVAGGFSGGPRGGWSGSGVDAKLGAAVVANDEVQQFIAGQSKKAKATIDVGAFEMKNTILGESGSPQEPSDSIVAPDRLPGIVPGAFRRLSILDFLPVGQTSGNRVDYTQENSWTSNAAETAEAGTKPESDATFELVEEPVRTIAHFLKTSKQVLDDSAALASYLDRRLRHAVRARLQSQILTGDGSSPNLAGLTSTGRHTDFAPSTGDTALDSINKAKYLTISADYSPDFLVLNPADWGSIERAKTTDDAYVGADGLGANFITSGYGQMLWQVPVIVTPDMTSGKFLLGDSSAMQLFWRQQAVVELFEQDDTNIQSNLLTIRAELRAALAVFNAAAIQYGDLTV